MKRDKKSVKAPPVSQVQSVAQAQEAGNELMPWPSPDPDPVFDPSVVCPIGYDAAANDQPSRQRVAKEPSSGGMVQPGVFSGFLKTATSPIRQRIYPLTDQGNLYLFISVWGHRVRFVEEQGKFLIWIRGKWLHEDKGGRRGLARLFKSFVSILYRQARSKKALYTRNGEPVTQEEMQAWAKASSQLSRRKALMEQLKDEPGIRISQVALDSDPCLLGVENGVLDLRSGILRANTPSHLITRYARAAYLPNALAPTFMQFLSQICLGRQDLMDFLQEVLGITLSGLTNEHAFFILLGTGANGKSTIIEVLYHLLGDYAKGMPGHAFIKSESRAIRNDLARLPGVRFAACAEINTGKALDESMVKRVTGGDVMTARFIGREFFDFHLSATFFFAVNTLPKVTGADNGIYRRLIVIPFDGDFQATRDKDLLDKLKTEVDGILAWAVHGFQRWRARGHLVQPACVKDASEAYRSEMDTVESFLNEICVRDTNAATPLGKLYDAYLEWAKTSHVEPAKLHLFGTLMGQKGFRKEKSGSWLWKGVALKPAAPAYPNALFASLSQPAQVGPTQ